jgi:hypothetical protein
MANTVIQIKRSTVTTAPTAGSLSAAEPAYSYLSDKLFIGSSDGTQVIEIGGRYYVNATIAAFSQANIANSIAIAAFDKANAANLLAYNTGIGANAYATAVGVAANSYADSVGGTVGVAANNYANSTFVKLVAPNQTITGSLAVTGSLTVSGNAFSIDTETLRVSDPLIYLAGNNYTSDIVDIGFVGNYNTGSANLHTGLFRDATNKEYYVFDGYNQEPIPNHIDTSANGFSLAVLNATIKTSNLILGGANAILTIAGVGTAANAFAAATIAGANSAVGAGANAYTDSVNTTTTNYLLAVIAGANSAVGAGANAFASATIAGANTAVGAGANAFATAVGTAANTNAANASYLSTGTVPSAQISGSYTGITGVGTITAGVWNGTAITVPYGGTGMTSFTSNGILYGNTTGSLKVTAAGTEGQVLQASAAGIPSFGMLDGGIF